MKGGMGYYLRAVIAANQDKPEVALENLKLAVENCGDPAMDQRTCCKKDLEFAKLLKSLNSKPSLSKIKIIKHMKSCLESGAVFLSICQQIASHGLMDMFNKYLRDARLKGELFEHLPDNNAGSHRYIQRVFGAILWDLNALITQIHHLLIHSSYLMTKYKCIFLISGKAEADPGLTAPSTCSTDRIW